MSYELQRPHVSPDDNPTEYFLNTLDPNIAAIARSLPADKREAYIKGLVEATNAQLWPGHQELTGGTNPLDKLPE